MCDRALEKFSSNTYLKLLKGFGLKRLGKKKEANQLLRAVEAAPGDTASYGFDLEDLTNELNRRLITRTSCCCCC